MRRSIFVAALLLSFQGVSPRVRADDRSGDKLGEGVHRMKRVQLIDRHGFEKPLPALSLLVPVDWKMDGAVTWSKGGAGCGEMFKLAFDAQSPDRRTGIELFPAVLWQWSDDPGVRQMAQAQNQQGARFGKAGCELMPLMSAADFLARQVAPKARPGAKLLGSEPTPAHAQLQEATQKQQQQLNQMGIRQQLRGDDARVKISYSREGAPEDEWLTGRLLARATPVPVFSNGRAGQSVSYQVEARFLFALRAPAGQLEKDEKLYQLILSTLRVEPEWQARVQQVAGNIAAIQRKGEADRARIRAQAADDVRKTQREMYEHQQQAQDDEHAQFSQYLRGVETYKDPNTGEKVELDSRYGHAWSNGAGEYILSESPDFDPKAHLNGNWTQLEQTRP